MPEIKTIVEVPQESEEDEIQAEEEKIHVEQILDYEYPSYKDDTKGFQIIA